MRSAPEHAGGEHAGGEHAAPEHAGGEHDLPVGADPFPRSGHARRTPGELRADLLAAAAEIIRARGPQAATTREIARLAGCAEGSIYRHFADKHALFLELTGDAFPRFVALIEALPSLAGTATVREHLEDVGCRALAFYTEAVPLAAAAINDAELRADQQRHFAQVPHHGQAASPHGPLGAITTLEAYVRREQELGRIAVTVSATAAATLLLSACFSRAFILRWLGEDARLGMSDGEFVRETVGTLLSGLGSNPPGGVKRPARGPEKAEDHGRSARAGRIRT